MTTKTTMKTTALALLLAMLCSVLTSVDARLSLPSLRLWTQPSADQAPRHARQLVHKNTWTTLSTNSIDFPGTPMGHVVSYSDGIGKSATNSTGEIFFYLTKLDEAAQNLEKDARASVTISLIQQGERACKKDVEDPTCWKLTLIGRVVPVMGDAKTEYALDALFSKHPEMESWPRNHGFGVYVLQIDTMVLLDFYGGPKHIMPDDYYKIVLSDD